MRMTVGDKEAPKRPTDGLVIRPQKRHDDLLRQTSWVPPPLAALRQSLVGKFQNLLRHSNAPIAGCVNLRSSRSRFAKNPSGRIARLTHQSLFPAGKLNVDVRILEKFLVDPRGYCGKGIDNAMGSPAIHAGANPNTAAIPYVPLVGGPCLQCRSRQCAACGVTWRLELIPAIRSNSCCGSTAV